MGWRFRKSIRIFPGVRLNIGKRGLTSATIGPHGGAHLNLNRRGDVGVAVTPISGAGISWRQRIGNVFGRVVGR
jgi:hypothetical protein